MPSWTIVFAASAFAVLLFAACGADSTVATGSARPLSPTGTPTATPAFNSPSAEGSLETKYADVLQVSANGSSGDYSLSVTVQSPDSGCARYADWWEVVSTDGRLIYRRVLLHSHVDEQPFTRLGGPVIVRPDEEVIVRAHMNDTGYGGRNLRGSVAGGFTVWESGAGFAAAVEKQRPQPSGCGF